MQLIDWIIVATALLLVIGVAIYTQQYMKSVADFLSAGRVARRYLLAVSKGEMQAGAVVFVAAWEVYNKSGFTTGWWGTFTGPIMLVVTIAGFVIYRYRETRALTLGQFFEIRYSKRFRLFAGYLGFFAGLLNFGIIPAVGARFMVYLLGLPGSLPFLGLELPTYVLLMGLFLSVNLVLTLSGGLITIMMTNCVEGIVSQLLYIVIIFGLLSMFSWSDISDVLSHQPPHQSLMNPMDSSGLQDFNISYVIMMMLVNIYGTMAWQNQSAYQSAPLTAHEARMGGILGQWREKAKSALITLLALCAMTYMHHPHYAAQSAAVHAQLAAIPDGQIREQMEIPLAVTNLLPAGLRGALCVILLLGIFGGDSTHLHSWGSIFIQDAVLPFRKRAFTPEQHIRLLRFSVIGVALFAFVFGSLFQQTEYVQMWWSVTQSVFVGGAGAAIIGGLYWKKGTTAGAWAGLLIGSTLSVGGIVAKQFHGHHLIAAAKNQYHAAFGQMPGNILGMAHDTHNLYLYFISYNGVEISFLAMLAAVATYIGVSWWTCRSDFNMDRMLHRGAYAIAGEEQPAGSKARITWSRIIGYDENFSTSDKWVTGTLFGLSMIFFAIVLVGTIWNLLQPWPLSVWSGYYHFLAIFLAVFFALATTIWFTWGGISDSLALFRQLRQEKVNPLDDGRVVGHRNLDEAAAAKTSPRTKPSAPTLSSK
jgi:SSS family solute:Na+ symporter